MKKLVPIFLLFFIPISFADEQYCNIDGDYFNGYTTPEEMLQKCPTIQKGDLLLLSPKASIALCDFTQSVITINSNNSNLICHYRGISRKAINR